MLVANDTLNTGGHFVLVASGRSSGKKGKSDRFKTLNKELKAAGLHKDRIVVFGSERLAKWVYQPAKIAARWANRSEVLCSLHD